MTKAVCFRCGDIKFGAFNPCGACGETPRNDEDLILSLAMTDHYFNDPVVSRNWWKFDGGVISG